MYLFEETALDLPDRESELDRIRRRKAIDPNSANTPEHIKVESSNNEGDEDEIVELAENSEADLSMCSNGDDIHPGKYSRKPKSRSERMIHSQNVVNRCELVILNQATGKDFQLLQSLSYGILLLAVGQAMISGRADLRSSM